VRGRSRATVSRPPSPDRSKLIRCVRLREVYGSVVFGEHALTDTSVTVDVTVQPTRMSGYCHPARNDETTRKVGILLVNINWSYPSHICSNPSNNSVAQAKSRGARDNLVTFSGCRKPTSSKARNPTCKELHCERKDSRD
jgi:hypothetical protein